MSKFRICTQGEISIRHFSYAVYLEKLREQVEVQSRQAIREWFKAALEKIPTYTGTARATLTPVGRLINRVVTFDSINSSKKYFEYKGQKYPLGITAGSSYGEANLSIILSGTRIISEFIYRRTLPYAVWNEALKAPGWFPIKHTTPENALVAAGEAWKHYVLNVLPKRLPKIKDSITVTHHKVR